MNNEEFIEEYKVRSSKARKIKEDRLQRIKTINQRCIEEFDADSINEAFNWIALMTFRNLETTGQFTLGKTFVDEKHTGKLFEENGKLTYRKYKCRRTFHVSIEHQEWTGLLGPQFQEFHKELYEHYKWYKGLDERKKKFEMEIPCDTILYMNEYCTETTKIHKLVIKPSQYGYRTEKDYSISFEGERSWTQDVNYIEWANWLNEDMLTIIKGVTDKLESMTATIQQENKDGLHKAYEIIEKHGYGPYLALRGI